MISQGGDGSSLTVNNDLHWTSYIKLNNATVAVSAPGSLMHGPEGCMIAGHLQVGRGFAQCSGCIASHLQSCSPRVPHQRAVAKSRALGSKRSSTQKATLVCLACLRFGHCVQVRKVPGALRLVLHSPGHDHEGELINSSHIVNGLWLVPAQHHGSAPRLCTKLTCPLPPRLMPPCVRCAGLATH